jgi:DSHCT (NUC185) domain
MLIGCKKKGIHEGSLIRAFRLLVEVLRQMLQASKVIGNTELENKFAAEIMAIKRDIIFSPSLVGALILSELISLLIIQTFWSRELVKSIQNASYGIHSPDIPT